MTLPVPFCQDVSAPSLLSFLSLQPFLLHLFFSSVLQLCVGLFVNLTEDVFFFSHRFVVNRPSYIQLHSIDSPSGNCCVRGPKCLGDFLLSLWLDLFL